MVEIGGEKIDVDDISTRRCWVDYGLASTRLSVNASTTTSTLLQHSPVLVVYEKKCVTFPSSMLREVLRHPCAAVNRPLAGFRAVGRNDVPRACRRGSELVKCSTVVEDCRRRRRRRWGDCRRVGEPSMKAARGCHNCKPNWAMAFKYYNLDIDPLYVLRKVFHLFENDKRFCSKYS